MACTDPANCTSAKCVDGVCCNSVCNLKCQACNLSTPGMCLSVPSGTNDGFCTTGKCISGGRCLGDLGDACALDNECQTTHCVDKVCCGNGCIGACLICNLTGSEGACVTDPACSATPT